MVRYHGVAARSAVSAEITGERVIIAMLGLVAMTALFFAGSGLIATAVERWYVTLPLIAALGIAAQLVSD